MNGRLSTCCHLNIAFLWAWALVVLSVPSECFLISFPTFSNSLSEAKNIGWQLNQKISSEEIRTRLQQKTQHLQAKDRQTRAPTFEELKKVYEDEYLVVIDKPSGVLCVSNDEQVASLAKTVFEACKDTSDLSSPDQMIVHRLGSDTSGLIILAKTKEAVRGINALFRTRKIVRQYEALLCGHLSQDEGLISLPLMRDYEHPPYMRVSTDEHQRHLLDLDPDIVGRKLLEAPKSAMTHFQVKARESLNGNEELAVTRVTLTSISGRTHQLNVHCAASGHPIVYDTVYGWNGDAAPNGGLQEASLPQDRASQELQEKIAATSNGRSVCVHAKLIRFRHPITKNHIECTSAAPF